MTRPGQPYVPSSYWESLLGTHFDESGVAYPELSASFNRAIYAAQIGAVSRALGDHSVEPESVLDIGPGIGIWIRFWNSRGVARIHGVDLTNTAVSQLRVRFPEHTFRQEDISTQGALAVEPVDAVSAMSVLLHITDESAFRRAMSNLAGAVRPGGWAVLLEPAVVHRWWGPPFGPSANSRARTIEQWDSAFTAVGFDLIDVRTVTVLLANPCDTRTSLGWKVASFYWRAVRKVVGKQERVGAVAGRVLLGLDYVARRLVRTGPSTKLLLARRRCD